MPLIIAGLAIALSFVIGNCGNILKLLGNCALIQRGLEELERPLHHAPALYNSTEIPTDLEALPLAICLMAFLNDFLDLLWVVYKGRILCLYQGQTGNGLSLINDGHCRSSGFISPGCASVVSYLPLQRGQDRLNSR